jgi:hypothetical protein
VVVEYLYDSFVEWEGAEITRAMVKDGAEAQRFLEHCLSEYKPEKAKMLTGNRKCAFANIPFGVQESNNGRRLLNLETGATHPPVWREMYKIIVGEIR